MLFVLLTIGCFPEFPNGNSIYFIDNPKHDYDGDGLLDAEDCDDSNWAIRVPVTYYQDLDLDGYPLIWMDLGYISVDLEGFL